MKIHCMAWPHHGSSFARMYRKLLNNHYWAWVLLLVTNHGIAFLRHQGYIATTNNIHPPFPACFVPSIVLQFLHVLNHLTFRNSRLRVSVLLPCYG